jgi:magnesium-transporting ATPase (P-type)
MQERIQIIDAFRSVFGARRKLVEIRQRYLWWHLLASGFIISVALFASVTSVFMELSGASRLVWEDESMGLIVLLSLGSLMRWNPIFFEWRLLKHRQWLTNETTAADLRLENQALQGWILHQQSLLNNRLTKVGLLTTISVLMILSIWQLFSEGNNPVWSYLQTPVILLYLFAVLFFLREYRSLQRNLLAAEEKIKTS